MKGCPVEEKDGEIVCDFPETSYGIVKRVVVFSGWIQDLKRREGRHTVSILDYGCGTGSTLTQLLAHGGDEILGVDPHAPSIEMADAQNHFENVRYRVGDIKDLLDRQDRFDVIVCSEVVEHLKEPEVHLRSFRRLLNSPGILIVSVPNGHGPFERLKSLERHLDDLGVDRIFTWMGQSARKMVILALKLVGKKISPPMMGTLNQESPHVNFFRLADLEAICRQEGFEIVDARGRTLVCGPYVDFWLNRWPFRVLLPVNNALADWLPLRVCSDWMLLLRKEHRDD